jgi:hypothetical protein
MKRTEPGHPNLGEEKGSHFPKIVPALIDKVSGIRAEIL